MKKTIYFCNRCGKEIKTEGARIIPHFFDMASGGELGNIGVPDDDVHFCMECTKEIISELFQKPEEGKTVDKAVAKAGKKTRPKKEERLDAGKVMALHRAGWDNKKIADEMGVDERQIYWCIRYQTKKNPPGGGDPGDGKEAAIEERL